MTYSPLTLFSTLSNSSYERQKKKSLLFYLRHYRDPEIFELSRDLSPRILQSKRIHTRVWKLANLEFLKFFPESLTLMKVQRTGLVKILRLNRRRRCRRRRENIGDRFCDSVGHFIDRIRDNVVIVIVVMVVVVM